ncbi:MAG: DUF1501 domain-containing protein [Woeseiaceae bacterium]
MKTLNRRDFLKTSGAAAMFAATPGLAYSQVVGGAGPFDDYRALVCVFMFGGNDSFNTLVPNTTAEYQAYATSRQNLAILQNDLLPIMPISQPTPDFGLHPSMSALKGLFDAGDAAFVTNVGPLVEPTTKDDYFNGSVILPPQLFSHNDQQDQWTTLRGNAQSKTGWAGRMADLIRSGVTDQEMATNASLFGANLFQSADETVAYVMGPGGPIQFEGFSTDPQSILFEQREAFLRVINAQYGTVYERGFADVQRRAIEAADVVTAAIASAPPINAVFPQSQLGTQLQTVARLIAVRDQLQMKRQVFFVATGGFDTHDEQLNRQPGLLGGISDAIAAFHSATMELGVENNVTTFTQSDFARTLTSNGDGTDHAWGGNQVVVGGAVNGRELYGSYPLLAIDGPEDVSGGRMIPSTSADQYAATLAKWFGIPDADLDLVAPNLVNFAARDLGFMIA